MVEELGPSRYEATADRQHLNLLSAFHYVGAGLAVIGIGCVALHYAVFNTVMNNPAAWAGNPSPPPPGLFDVFKWFYAFFGAWLGSSFLLNLLAGIYLRARKHRTFCFIVAGTNCLHMPIGTVLGIFTIIVLARDSVRATFQTRADTSRLAERA